MNFEKLDKTRESRDIATSARYHAHEMVLALEVYYWTGDIFHYEETISHFENLVSEMAKLQNMVRKEVKNA